MNSSKLSAIIDFGSAAIENLICDLVMAWIYLSGKSRETFIFEVNMKKDTWLRVRTWAL
tara:strand:+ start:129 stop:305 length:177 start_codon:yes stop_codon:yes gene_type:complete